MLINQILLVLVGIVVGIIIGFFITKKLIMKSFETNPPINEEVIRQMMVSMGRPVNQKQINQMMAKMRGMNKK